VLCWLASANTIIVTGVDNSRGENIWINENKSSTDTQAYAGVIDITVTDNSGTQYNRISMCVDLFTQIQENVTYNTTVLNPDQVTGKNLLRVAWLMDNALLDGAGLPKADWVTTAAQGAGLQLAIWDIVHDNGDGLTSGNVERAQHGHSTPSDVQTWVTTYLNASLGKSSDTGYVYQNVTTDTGTVVQMLIGPTYDTGPGPTPEPPTFALVGGALIAIGQVVRWTRRRKNLA